MQAVEKLAGFPWLRILIWGVVLGVLVALLKSWGAWSELPIRLLWCVLLVVAGGLVGWLLNMFFGFYVGLGTNVIESMGIFRFTTDAPKKIENGFIFTCAVVGALAALLFVH